MLISKWSGYMAGQRTIITLPDEDRAWLEEYSKAHGISMAEGVRTALRLLRENKQKDTYRALVERTQGTWVQGDGLDYQRRLRADWEDNAGNAR
jgi:Arc/MetJ-type ribon-helix-helix transcriptional regulator